MTNFQKLTPVIPTKAIARGGIFGIHTTVAVTKDPSTNARDDFFVISDLTLCHSDRSGGILKIPRLRSG
jgi:hypothetical protein